MTTSPRPGPPISPAITTIESANRIIWLTERSSIRRASGSCTFDEHLPAGRAHRLGGLDRVRGHAADSERRDPDRRRDRVDHRRHDGGARADREEDHDRDQIGEGGDDLHRVEDRRDRAVEPVGAAGEHAERHADEQRERHGGEHQREGLHALVPQPHQRRTRGTRRASPSAALRPPKRSTTTTPSDRRPHPGQLRKKLVSHETRLSRNVAKPLKIVKTKLGFADVALGR